MKRFQFRSLENIYKFRNTKKIRDHIAYLIFGNECTTLRSKKGKPVYKVRLCRTMALKAINGAAHEFKLNGKLGGFLKKKFGKDDSRVREIHECTDNKGSEFKMEYAIGYYPHIWKKNKWRPIWIKTQQNFRSLCGRDPITEIMVCWYENESKGKKEKRVYLGDLVRSADPVRLVKAKEVLDPQTNNDSTIVEDILEKQLKKLHTMGKGE
jgi:hypothetical protein